MRRFAPLLVATAVALLAISAAPAGAALITVNGTVDTIANDGLVSLREAITSIDNQADVNADVTSSRIGGYSSTPGGTPDVINFNIPGSGVQTINASTSEPTISRPLTINGLTQVGSSTGHLLVRLDGTSAGSGANGLVATAKVTLEGLIVTGFSGSGVKLDAGSTNSVVAADFIGLDATGTIAEANGTGVTLAGTGSTLGGSAGGSANVISGNTSSGVAITGSANTVTGNEIGTEAGGTTALANGGDGVLITGTGQNTVGGPGAAGNVISGNALNGVVINGSSGNVIAENDIGTDSSGGVPLGNGHDGVAIENAAGNDVQASSGDVVRDSNNGGFAVDANVDGNFFGQLIAVDDAAGVISVPPPTPGGTLAISADRRTVTGTLTGLTPGLPGQLEVYLGSCGSLNSLLGSGSATATSTADAAVTITLPSPAPLGTIVGLVTGPATGTSPVQCRATPTPPSAASITALGASPHKFSLAGRRVKGRCVKPTAKSKTHKACKRPIKLTISYALNETAIVAFTLQRQASGRKVDGRCAEPTKTNHKRSRCTRLVDVRGTITMAGSAGANTFAFNGEIGSKRLAAGAYELAATPAGGTPQTVKFSIVG